MVIANASTETNLTAAEVADRIRSLSDADKIRLIRASNYLSFGGARAPADLRQEAIRRAIAGTRKCRSDLSIIAFLKGAMRSIAWADRRTISRASKLAAVPNDGPTSNTASNGADPRVSAEEMILERDRLTEIREGILSLFDDDAAARLLADGMMNEIEGEELRNLLELTEVEFASKRRLVRRRIDKAFPKGWQS
jgi:hypothetical protein